jgi:hypothetical protein
MFCIVSQNKTFVQQHLFNTPYLCKIKSLSSQHVLRIVDLSNEIGVGSFLHHYYPERVIQNQPFRFLT